MKRFLKTLGITVLVALATIAAALAFLYATFCGGHPHGLC